MPWAVAMRVAGERLRGDGGQLEGGSHGVVDPGCDAHGWPILPASGRVAAVFQLRFTTVVEAPLTVAFDVARTLGRPWGARWRRSCRCGRSATSTRSGPAGAGGG